MKFKKLLPIVGVIILIIIINTLDLQKIIDIFSKINPVYSILSFLIIIPLIVLTTIEWQLLLKKQKIKVSFSYSIKNFFIGYFYGFITPGAFGAYTRSIYLSEESGVPLPKCVSNIIIFNTIEYLGMLSVGAIGAIYLSSIYPYLFHIIIVIIIIVISLFSFFFKFKRSRILFTKIVQSRIFVTVRNRIKNSITSFYEDLPKFKDVILPFGISVFGWFLKYIMMFFVAKLFFIEIPFLYFIMVMAVADVIASLPISIYGLGTREAALITMFKFWDVQSEKIVSLSLFLFVIIWLTPSVIGSFITFFETKKLGKFVLTGKSIKKFEIYMKKYPELYRYTTEIVKKNIPKKVDKPVIIDLGAGPGLLSSEMGKQIPNAQIIAIDPSDKMLDLANKNVKKEGFKTIIGTSEHIALKNDFADIVVSRFNLTYWKKPRDSLIEIRRVLKPGGKIVLEALNKDFPKYYLFLIEIHMFFKSAGLDIIRYHLESYKTAYKIQHTERLLKNAGFKITYKEFNKNEWKYLIIAKK
ncbi:MAG: flippase-like domain-containing protein [Thermoplasmatales archaeon]|nr:flippase-like domain-containing protein [Thermoplasmatales archaeon]